jgi:HJR/Mrr/RecB family endonuclease
VKIIKVFFYIPFFPFIIFYKMLQFAFYHKTNRLDDFRIRSYSHDEVAQMLYSLSPRGFEVLIAELHIEKGYNAILTPIGNDYGRDVIVKTREGDIFIECKRFEKNNYVGREIAQKLLGSMQMFNAVKGIICTTGRFHPNAYEVAGMVNNLLLLDTNDIVDMILELSNSKINRIFSKAKSIA